MKVTISIDGSTNEFELEDLHSHERNTILGLLIPNSLKDEAFAPFTPLLSPFIRINPSDLCPEHHGAHRIADTRVETWPGEYRTDLALKLKRIANDNKLQIPRLVFKEHWMKGYCKECQKLHGVSKNSVMVRFTYKGSQVQRLFEIPKEE